MGTRRTTTLALLAATAVAVSACSTQAEPGSDPAKTLTVGVDLPFQGASKDLSTAILNAAQLYLDQVGGRAGRFKVVLERYDNSTVEKGSWDAATCEKNAKEHLANADEVAVLAPYNSPCSIAQVPILNADPGGPMAMVACCNTYPGLTKAWNPDEPGKHYPTGKRNYARVINADDLQGAGLAQFAKKELGVKRCAVLDDGQAYGKGISRAFGEEARKQGIEVTAEQSWDARAEGYSAMFRQIRTTNPDCVFLGGIYDQNGDQVVIDKTRFVGDNDDVKLIAPSGFSGYPALLAQPEAQGAYLAFAGIDKTQLRIGGRNGAEFLDAYKNAYGADPATNYFVYGALAMQIVLAAIAESDGTRKGVRDAIFEGDGVTVPKAISVVDREAKIDPGTGDIDMKALTVLQVRANRETSLMAWSVT